MKGMIVRGNQPTTIKNHAPMIHYHSQKQLPLADFDWPFQTALNMQ